MSMSKKLSVIVPVYNVEPYLRRCIDSIINQTYKNLEIILVDDGSPDNCGIICDEYAKQDSRIRVIHQKNAGLSAARNVGINIASGHYIAFLDSDDYISKDMYKSMIEVLEENDIDIISCSVCMVKGDKFDGSLGDGRVTIFNHDEIILKVLSDFDVPATNKVYKKSVVDNIRFPVGRKFEDTATVYLFFDNARTVGYLNKAYYFYYRNPKSITQTSFDAAARYDFVLGYLERLNFANKNNLLCINQCKSLLLKAALSCLTSIYAYNNKVDNDLYLKIKNIILKYRSDDGAYDLLNIKYKIFLWSFGRIDTIHIIGAKLSRIMKSIRRKRGFLKS